VPLVEEDDLLVREGAADKVDPIAPTLLADCFLGWR
jgi:hypothetical protein